MAQRWLYLTENSTGGIIFVDVDSTRDLEPVEVVRPFPVVQVWVKSNFMRDKSRKERETLALHRVNCENETSYTASYTSYRPDGSVIDTFSESDRSFQYEPVAPGTIAYAIMEFACGRRPAIGKK